MKEVASFLTENPMGCPDFDSFEIPVRCKYLKRGVLISRGEL